MKKNDGKVSVKLVFLLTILMAIVCTWHIQEASAGLDPAPNLQGFGQKIFRVESGLYPFVQIYIRTFNQNMDPLVNLNIANIGLMVKGQVYDPAKRQYNIQSIRSREEAIRSILVIDTSKSMQGAPFDAALRAAARFIDAKRFQDQVAVIALDDNVKGYTLVSNFERDPGALGRRIADITASGKKTRLYDGIAAALKLAAGVGAGGTTTTDAQYVASTSIVVFSDGKDEESAITRQDLMNRISNLKIPVPIYSLAYTKIEPKYLKNLQALSKNSFGKYFHIGKAYNQMTRTVEDIQNILQSDYVIMFRSYLPVDGEKHIVKIGIEYPSGSGKMRYESGEFEAISPPNFPKILNMQQRLNEIFPPLPDANPYMTNPYAPVAPINVQQVAPPAK